MAIGDAEQVGLAHLGGFAYCIRVGTRLQPACLYVNGKRGREYGVPGKLAGWQAPLG